MCDKNPIQKENTEKRMYGWIPDPPDINMSFLSVAHPNNIKRFPTKITLEDLPPVFNQGLMGSCCSNAISTAFHYEQRRSKLKEFIPSRLFNYFNARKFRNNTAYDHGTTISDCIKSLVEHGICPETIWPYDISEFSTCPPFGAYQYAKDHKVTGSLRVRCTIDGFKTILNMGLPIIFGFYVFDHFESDEMKNTGILKLPEKAEIEKKTGAHAALCIGYDDEIKCLEIRNSWGPEWGIDGNFLMPYDYVDQLHLISDAWAITKTEEYFIKLSRKMSMPSMNLKSKIISQIKNIYKKCKS
jgi:C1A family cysteine protease